MLLPTIIVFFVFVTEFTVPNEALLLPPLSTFPSPPNKLFILKLLATLFSPYVNILLDPVTVFDLPVIIEASTSFNSFCVPNTALLSPIVSLFISPTIIDFSD